MPTHDLTGPHTCFHSSICRHATAYSLDRIDRVLLNPFLGVIVFLALMYAMFQPPRYWPALPRIGWTALCANGSPQAWTGCSIYSGRIP